MKVIIISLVLVSLFSLVPSAFAAQTFVNKMIDAANGVGAWMGGRTKSVVSSVRAAGKNLDGGVKNLELRVDQLIGKVSFSDRIAHFPPELRRGLPRFRGFSSVSGVSPTLGAASGVSHTKLLRMKADVDTYIDALFRMREHRHLSHQLDEVKGTYHRMLDDMAAAKGKASEAQVYGALRDSVAQLQADLSLAAYPMIPGPKRPGLRRRRVNASPDMPTSVDELLKPADGLGAYRRRLGVDTQYRPLERNSSLSKRSRKSRAAADSP